MKHDCGCTTEWSDELDHPVYRSACATHKHQVPNGWGVEKRKPVRQPVRV